VALVAAFFTGRVVYRALASDETRIRWVLEEEAEAFNGARMLTILDGFAPEYRDATTGLKRGELRAALLHVFQSRRDPATRRFLYRVELPEADLRVEVDGDTARATFRLRLHEGSGAGEELAWELDVAAELERRDGEWLVIGSRHETLHGGRPRR